MSTVAPGRRKEDRPTVNSHFMFEGMSKERGKNSQKGQKLKKSARVLGKGRKTQINWLVEGGEERMRSPHQPRKLRTRRKNGSF